MAVVTKIEFDNPINSSLQIGDAIYVSDRNFTHNSAGVYVPDGTTSGQVYAKKVIEIGSHYIVVNKNPGVSPIISSGQYIFFAKDIRVNESSLKGYYADVAFKNSSFTKTELFAISSEVTLSSK